MCLLPCGPGIKRELGAPQRLSVALTRGQQRPTNSLRTMRRIRYEVIDVDLATRNRLLKHTPDRDATHRITIGSQGHPRPSGQHL